MTGFFLLIYIIMIVNCKQISDKNRYNLSMQIELMMSDTNVIPHLALIVNKFDSITKMQVQKKVNACKEIGIKCTVHELNDATIDDFLKLIKELNEDSNVHGIAMQLPLAGSLDYFSESIINNIIPEKDVEGLSLNNINKKWSNNDNSFFDPCLPKGIFSIINHFNISLFQKNILILNTDKTLGLPIIRMLLNHEANVQICPIINRYLVKYTQKADIIITSINQINLINKNMVKDNVIIFDLGYNKNYEGEICGDVNINNIKDKCKYISSISTGLDELCITSLLQNVLLAYRRQV